MPIARLRSAARVAVRPVALLLLLCTLLAGPGLAGPGLAGPGLAGPGLAGAPGAVDPGVVPVGRWPLLPEPPVVAGFDPPDAPWGPGHRGVDLLGRPGAPVRAALAGTVSFAGVIAGRGVVVVSHGATRTTYQPVSASIGRGARVAAGAVLGGLATRGSHCAPRSCLHWGWRRGDTYLDPLLLVGAGPVRLLPLWRDAPVGSAALPRLSAYAGWAPPRPAYAGWPGGWWGGRSGGWPGAVAPGGLRPGGAPAGRPVGGGPW